VVGQRPVDLIGDELDVALRKQIDLLDRVHEPAVRFVGSAVPRLADERLQAVYRVAQEAMHNALRHADASRVDVDLVHSNGFVELEVRDDGRGFDPLAAGEATRRLGLASMRERARSVGGRLTVNSNPGGGTSVRLAVPVE
jgi:signal transduction histidine kinase